MNKPTSESTKDEVLAYLSAEFVKFDTKKEIVFQLEKPITHARIEVDWTEGVKFDTYEDNYFEDNLVCSIGDVDKQIEKEIQKLQDELKDFLDDCDSFAKIFGIHPEKFFDEIVDFVKKDKD